jgi:hypothetical protein
MIFWIFYFLFFSFCLRSSLPTAIEGDEFPIESSVECHSAVGRGLPGITANAVHQHFHRPAA